MGSRRVAAKDAGLAWDKLSERKKRGRQDPSRSLPGGKYTRVSTKRDASVFSCVV